MKQLYYAAPAELLETDQHQRLLATIGEFQVDVLRPDALVEEADAVIAELSDPDHDTLERVIRGYDLGKKTLLLLSRQANLSSELEQRSILDPFPRGVRYTYPDTIDVARSTIRIFLQIHCGVEPGFAQRSAYRSELPGVINLTEIKSSAKAAYIDPAT